MKQNKKTRESSAKTNCVDVFSDDVSRIEFEFEPVDYENYEYSELGILDFSKPPGAPRIFIQIFVDLYLIVLIDLIALI